MAVSYRPTLPICHTKPALLWLLCLTFLGGACSYDSSLGAVECSNESSRSQGRVCRDGLWVAEDDADSIDDATGDADATADTDASPCPEGQTLCGTTCVDTTSSADHCGGCNRPCTPFGAQSPAQCQQGMCEHSCAEGWTDANGDWIGTTIGTTDGCELECTPTEDPTEVCDGVDNDCNGQIDENVTTRYYLDSDQDGYGVTIDFQDLCAPEGDYQSTEDGDCDDGNPQVHPTAENACNGVDDNCDGTIDEGCSCINGETMPCYSGSAATEGVGPCHGGTTTCTDGSWGSCQDEVVPVAETCDGVDNDCDGDTDDGVLNTYYADADGDGYGDASATAMGCSAPLAHVANADDCNDSVSTIHPSATETCNGADDNCDGVTDEGFSEKGDTCSVGVGTCENQGVLVCTADGSSTECSATAHAPDATETCGDGLDNTCNGLVDDGCACNFNGDPDGVCGSATLIEAGNCEQPSTYQSNETTCDGLDNDCDGDVDEGLTTTYYADADADGYPDASSTTQACSQPAGYMSARGDNEVDCDDGNSWTNPGASEICDGRDNDCSGSEGDDGGSSAESWCESRFSDNSLRCIDHGPSNTLCCEANGDGDTDCDNESVCDNGVDEDDDGDTDCADVDCGGLYCAPGKICDAATGSCVAL